jgi:hypothetical protein
MTIYRFVAFLRVCAAVTMLTACTTPTAFSSFAAAPLAVANPADHKSKDLLYISTANSTIGSTDVTFFTYPAGKLVATIRGFSNPRGLCVDKSGNVFITNFSGADVLEYPHGSTIPKRNIEDTGHGPYGCSVDPTSGNLAVANYCSGNPYGTGSCSRGSAAAVTVFSDAKGQPKAYTNPAFENFFFCSYDGSGNLFVDGYGAVGYSLFEFGEIPRGGTALKRITLNQMIEYPGGVQWDGQHIAVGDYRTGIIYQFAIKGSSGKETGSTTLTDGEGTNQFWIDGDKVIAAGYIYQSYYDTQHFIGVWNYPAGGAPTQEISGYANLYGIAVSPAK